MCTPNTDDYGHTAIENSQRCIIPSIIFSRKCMMLSFVKRLTHEVSSVSATINTTHTHARARARALSSDELLTNEQQKCQTHKTVPEQSDHLSSVLIDK